MPLLHEHQLHTVADLPPIEGGVAEPFVQSEVLLTAVAGEELETIDRGRQRRFDLLHEARGDAAALEIGGHDEAADEGGPAFDRRPDRTNDSSAHRRFEDEPCPEILTQLVEFLGEWGKARGVVAECFALVGGPLQAEDLPGILYRRLGHDHVDGHHGDIVAGGDEENHQTQVRRVEQAAPMMPSPNQPSRLLRRSATSGFMTRGDAPHRGPPTEERVGMGQEMSAEFYDENVDNFLLPLEKSPWLDLYQVAVTLVPVPHCRVADLGCGTGRFARLLTHHGVTSYWGVDFSPTRIEEARRYVPELEFHVGDLRDPHIRARFPEFDTFIVIEVLEHIEDDLGLLAAIPQGALVVYTVPTYDAAAHVRVFESIEAIHHRYGSLLATDSGQIHTMIRPAKPTNRVFIGSARRR